MFSHDHLPQNAVIPPVALILLCGRAGELGGSIQPSSSPSY
jgi:hypothetical protein